MKTFKAGLHRSLAFLFVCPKFQSQGNSLQYTYTQYFEETHHISTHLEGSKNPTPPNPVSNISLLCYLFRTNRTLGNNILWPSALLQSDGHGIGQPHY